MFLRETSFSLTDTSSKSTDAGLYSIDTSVRRLDTTPHIAETTPHIADSTTHRVDTTTLRADTTSHRVDTTSLLSRIDCETLHDHILPYLDVSSLHQLLLTCRSLFDLVESFLHTTRCLIISDKTRKQLKESQLQNLAHKTGNLHFLDVSNCSDALTNVVLRTFISLNPDIKLLNISGCIRVNGSAFKPEHDDATILDKLEILIANWSRNFNHECLMCLSHAPIRVLSIAGTWYTTDQSISECISWFNASLECLNVNKCYKVSDVSISKLVKCPRLRILKISSCWRVNDQSVREVIENCDRLEQIAMDDCRAVSKDMLASVHEIGLLLLEGCMKDVQKLWDTSQHYLRKDFRF